MKMRINIIAMQMAMGSVMALDAFGFDAQGSTLLNEMDEVPEITKGNSELYSLLSKHATQREKNSLDTLGKRKEAQLKSPLRAIKKIPGKEVAGSRKALVDQKQKTERALGNLGKLETKARAPLNKSQKNTNASHLLHRENEVKGGYRGLKNTFLPEKQTLSESELLRNFFKAETQSKHQPETKRNALGEMPMLLKDSAKEQTLLDFGLTPSIYGLNLDSSSALHTTHTNTLPKHTLSSSLHQNTLLQAPAQKNTSHNASQTSTDADLLAINNRIAQINKDLDVIKHISQTIYSKSHLQQSTKGPVSRTVNFPQGHSLRELEQK
ncbi:hypothetical protein NEOKW01_0868 [Nematocida sp. AWRm80]|nr:hypothetical protein NEOKW01_0868 [Nematocida sp. AWRm80]